MCMTCDGNESQNNSGGRRFSKKRIAILSTIGAGTAGAAYLSVTINPAIGATIPAVLALAACPAMCAAMGGTMWLSRRFSNKKRVGRKQQLQRRQQESKEEYSSSEQTAKEQQEKLAVVAVAETNEKKAVLNEQPSQQQPKKRKINSERQDFNLQVD